MTIRPTVLASVVLVTWAGAALAGDPAQRCYVGRSNAAGMYLRCQYRTMSRSYGGDLQKQRLAASRCVVRYAATWERLQAGAFGSHSDCDGPRFRDGGSVVVDNLTGLYWEKKSAANVADVYLWGIGGIPDGPVFTLFLEPLAAAGPAGRHDWRLPTVFELMTIVGGAYPCGTSPCIDALFGPTAPASYWSSTGALGNFGVVWQVSFADGGLGGAQSASLAAVRAVSGGL